MRYLLLAVTIHIGCRRGHSLAFSHRNSWNQIRIAGRRRGMKLISKLSVSMVAFVLLTAACGTEVSNAGTDRLPDDDQASGADDSPSLDGDWLLIDATIDGKALALDPDYDITLLIMASQVSGRAACNGYGGTASIDGTAFSIGDVGQTEMGCEPSVMDLEASYVAALGKVTTAHRTAEALTLTSEHVDLVFETIASVPTAELVGTEWLLDSIIEGDAVSSTNSSADQATLVLNADGTFTGTTGCRDLAGEYVVAGGSVQFTSWGAEGECPTELVSQDSQVITVLEGPFTVTIDGGRLTMTAPGGEGLSYTAQK